jgi:hypothetical protein
MQGCFPGSAAITSSIASDHTISIADPTTRDDAVLHRRS